MIIIYILLAVLMIMFVRLLMIHRIGLIDTHVKNIITYSRVEIGIFRWKTANGPITRYVKLLVAQAPGMSGTFSPQLWVSNPDMHHGTCVTHVPWCTPGWLTCGVFWCRWRGKHSRHSRRMRNPQFYVSSKRPIPWSCMCHQSINHSVIYQR